jgi:hypothetical protein
MLRNPIYLGRYVWNRGHSGKFHRWAGGRSVPELNYGGKESANGEADWVQGGPPFAPLIDRPTWDAVQRKLAASPKHPRAPARARHWLFGLLYCGQCGGLMYAAPGERRPKYLCSSYYKACRDYRLKEHRAAGGCRRNGVFQDELEACVGRFLEETGHKLKLLTGGPPPDPATGRLEGQEADAWGAWCAGVDRMAAYVAEHCPREYAAVVAEAARRRDEMEADALGARPAPPGSLERKYGRRVTDTVRATADDPVRIYGPGAEEGDFVAAVLGLYRVHFDPKAVDAEVARLDKEHTALTHRYADLPTPRAKDKAARELAALEARIGELEAQRRDAAEEVAAALRQMHDLQDAIHAARQAMRAGSGDRALRLRAGRLRSVVRRIEVSFRPTGERRSGRPTSLPEAVTVYPVEGDAATYPAPPRDAAPGVRYASSSIQRRTDRAARRYQRYFTFTNLHNNPAVSGKDLRLAQAALAKLLNSLSWKAGVVVPQPVDDQRTVFVVDIRKLDWDRGRLWDEVSKAYPYGLQHRTYPGVKAVNDAATDEVIEGGKSWQRFGRTLGLISERRKPFHRRRAGAAASAASRAKERCQRRSA